MVGDFLTLMQSYRLLAFFADSASLIPQNSFIRGHSFALAV